MQEGMTQMKFCCLLLVLIAGAGLMADDKQYVSAKAIFYAKGTPAGHGSAAGHPGRRKTKSKDAPVDLKIAYEDAGAMPAVKYQIIQRMANGSEVAVDPGAVFHSGDRIRLSVESNIDGYLYIVHQGSTGSWIVLFPSPKVNQGRNLIQKGTQYAVPSPRWFLFDSNPGSERLMVFLSKTVMKNLPGFDAPVTRDSTVEQGVVDELNNTVKSRDLVFEKDPAPSPNGPGSPAVYVANPRENGQAVQTTIILKHN